MTVWTAFRAEFHKAVSLPGVRAGLVLTLLGSIALTLLNAFSVRAALDAGRHDVLAGTSPAETAFAAMPLGTVGAVVIGVLVIGSEYTTNSPDAGGGRQITTTLAAVPRRATLLASKVCTVILLVLTLGASTLPATLVVARAVTGDSATEHLSLGDMVVRCLGGTTYWVLTGLLALAITVLARSVLVPLVILIANSSLVSFSLLLTALTPLAHWLPDLAGRRLLGLDTVDGGLAALPGTVVMAGWALLLLVVAGAVLARRDA
ncbi:ABC transporter permease [Actinoalloteichus caeruleus]|uniref:ABC transporter permease n=1 Tax=Actinoalloteichus cyanogriseus TaxID=2893586 RepID=UPI0004AA0509|nr:ABC transporter permease [Actinoalloteichus caeruleus]